MGRLTATMVVDLQDRTGAKTQAIIGNLNRLERAERNLVLARSGLRMRNVDRAQEELLMARAAAAEERRRQVMATSMGFARAAAVGVAAGGYVAGRAFTDFAGLERRVNRIVLNADKGAETVRPTIDMLQRVAKDTQIGFENTVTGLEALIASGRSLDEGLAFLPAVAVTAQASGAAIEDVALSADSLSGSMKIGARDMQKAFDILVAGGKAGKFELKDMSQYLPTLLPAFAALGYEGTEGLQKMVAMLQVVRNQTGTSSEAATNLGNVFQKMYSEETAKKFSKFGIDLPKALDKAKRNGEDILDVFLDMTALATKGDLSKLTRLFTDSEMQKGVRALLTQRDALAALTTSLGNVDGTAMRDFNQLVGDAQGSIERLSTSWDKLWTKIGQRVSKGGVPVMDAVTDMLDQQDAIAAGWQKTTGGDSALGQNQRREFEARYRKQNPDAGFYDIEGAYNEALSRVGRGAAETVMEQLQRLEQATALRKHYGHGYVPGRGVADLGKSTGKTPVPDWKPEGVDKPSLSQAYQYGTGRESIADSKDKLAAFYREMQQDRERARAATIRRQNFEDSTAGPHDPGLLERREMRQRDTPGGPQAVTLSGTPTVIAQPSGVQQVIVTNGVRPNFTVSVSMPVTIHEAVNAGQVAAQLGQRIRSEMDGLQASTNDSGL